MHVRANISCITFCGRFCHARPNIVIMREIYGKLTACEEHEKHYSFVYRPIWRFACGFILAAHNAIHLHNII